MRRAPSQRELVAALIACAESESEDDEELKQLLGRHGAVLADAIGVANAEIHAVATLSSTERSARVRALVRRGRERQQAVDARAMEGLSIAAASMLANLAKWQEDRVELDAKIVLGRGLCANRARKYVLFDAEGYAPVAIRRVKLREAWRALQFLDVICHLDTRGLCFTWRAGRGGLFLTSQEIASKERASLLPVVIARPVGRETQRGAILPTGYTPNWFREAFAQLTPL